ncbi:MAG: DUF3237 domain-containing protein [Oscillospiraceae bacterium]|nr:DUF3237 domain-containing protein [Oscillospiraceae bacterium]
MTHKSTAILEIHVETDPAGTVSLTGEIGTVTMIPFKGTVTGPIFSGIIEPCGVDTQITNQNEVRHMSARYMLTGRDMDGRSCHIYVENNGWFTNGARQKPFKTVPTFITDSPALAPLLHRNQFVGEGLSDENGLCIRIYELGTDK